MDTLSSSVTAVKLPTFTPATRELHHFKSRPPPPYRSHLTSATTTATPKTAPTHHRRRESHYFFQSSTSRSLPIKLPPNTEHRRPASGYAAALLDIAQSNGTLAAVQKDVGRLSRLLRKGQLHDFMEDESVGWNQKGEVMKEVMEKGGFNPQLVRLMDMLVGKGKIGIAAEVVAEFGRIYAELIGISGGDVASDPLLKNKKKMEGSF